MCPLFIPSWVCINNPPFSLAFKGGGVVLVLEARVLRLVEPDAVVWYSGSFGNWSGGEQAFVSPFGRSRFHSLPYCAEFSSFVSHDYRTEAERLAHLSPESLSAPMEEESGSKLDVQTAAAALAGVLLATGWLLFADGCATVNRDYGFQVPGSWYLPGILQTLSLFMINVVNWESVSDPDFEAKNQIRSWVFTAFVFAFSGIIASSWILITESLDDDSIAKQPAWKAFEQNLLIFLGSLAFRAARVTDGSN